MSLLLSLSCIFYDNIPARNNSIVKVLLYAYTCNKKIKPIISLLLWLYHTMGVCRLSYEGRVGFNILEGTKYHIYLHILLIFIRSELFKLFHIKKYFCPSLWCRETHYLARRAPGFDPQQIGSMPIQHREEFNQLLLYSVNPDLQNPAGD